MGDMIFIICIVFMTAFTIFGVVDVLRQINKLKDKE